jgi:hypothetical protein
MHFISPEFLDGVELPNSLQAVRVTAPDGRVFIASGPMGRVQRYGPSGFERGFAIDTRGGAFDVGISPDGDLLICSVRARGLITYDQDGRETGDRQPCAYRESNHGRIPSELNDSHAIVPFVALNWIAAIAVPLWHPIVAWLMIAASGLYLKFHPLPASNES